MPRAKYASVKRGHGALAPSLYLVRERRALVLIMHYSRYPCIPHIHGHIQGERIARSTEAQKVSQAQLAKVVIQSIFCIYYKLNWWLFIGTSSRQRSTYYGEREVSFYD